MQMVVPHRWKVIAEHVPGRDHIQCLQRWQKVLDPSLRKGFWNADEDALLVRLKHEADGAAPEGRVPSWSTIAKQITGRNTKQCRERWNNFLDPSLNMGPWSTEEDAILCEGFRRFGSYWSMIAKLLKGRTQTKIRDRWKFLSSTASRGRPHLRADNARSGKGVLRGTANQRNY